MSALRTLFVRSWVLWSLLLVAALSLSGCKKKGPEGEQPKAKSEAKAPEGKQQPLGEAEPALTDPIEGEPAVEAAVSPAPTAAGESEEKLAPVAPATSAPVYASNQDKVRMAELFAEMWCAELRGATKEQLFELYHKFDYPPLDRWHDDWNAVLVDRNWVRETVARARSRCPEEARKAELNAPTVAPAKPVAEADAAGPAPTAPEGSKQTAPVAPVQGEGDVNTPTEPAVQE